MTDGCMKLGNR